MAAVCVAAVIAAHLDGARLPYSARKVSSSDGSRLTKSASSYCAAARTTGVMLPGHAHAQDVVLGDDVGHAGQRAELLDRHRSVKTSSTWWWARSRSASVRSTRARRPSRMIATRSQVFSTSDRMCDDRKTVRPSALASRMTA